MGRPRRALGASFRRNSHMPQAMHRPTPNWTNVPVMGKVYALSTCLFQMLKKMFAAYHMPKSAPR
jgi:hypothetical protein